MNLPNKITLARIALIPVCLICLALESAAAQALAALLFVVAGLTDTLDGYIARSRKLITDFGKFMDPIADKLLVLLPMVLLVQQARLPSWVLIAFMAREFIVSGFRLVAAGNGKVIAAGPLGKYKTVTQMVGVVPLVLCKPLGALTPILDAAWLSALTDVCVYAAAALAVWSGADYIWRNRSVLGKDF